MAMNRYILEVKVVDDDVNLHNLYTKAISNMNTEEYKNKKYKDSGFDIYVPNGNMIIDNKGVKLIDMKIQCAAYKITHNNDECIRSPTGFYMYARSSIYKTQLRLANNVGIIDSGYRGNLMGAFDNKSEKQWHQSEQCYTRLLQICMPDLTPFEVVLVDSLDNTERGSGGFGSTGR